MLEEQISPILGMTLLGLVEWVAFATIAAGAAAIVGIIISLFNLRNANTQIRLLKTQIERQQKVDSARFTVDYVDKILVDKKDVIDVLNEREDDKTKKFPSEKDVRVLLNGFDNTIQFVNDGVIDKKQVLNTIRITLKMLKNDEEVQRIIREKREGGKPKAFDKLTEFWDNNID